MSSTYQKTSGRAGPDRQVAEITVPELVSMAEIAGAAKEGLLALAVGAGLQVMAAMFGEDVTGLCGPDGKHDTGRAGYRHGTGERVGDPGRAPCSGDPAAGAGRRRVRGAAPAVL